MIDSGLGGSAAAAAIDEQTLEVYLDKLTLRMTIDGGKDDSVLVGLRWTR